MLVFGLAEFGKLDAARPLVDTLRRVDPLNPNTYWAEGWVEAMGDTQRALPSFDRAHRMDPENPLSRFCLARALAFTGDRNEALALLEPMRQTPSLYWSHLAMALIEALEGHTEGVRKVLTHQVTRRARWDETFSWLIAEMWAIVGERDEALDWLDAAINHGFINYPFLAEHDRFLDPLRDEPRFRALLAEAERE